jgi:hypothetical protein
MPPNLKKQVNKVKQVKMPLATMYVQDHASSYLLNPGHFPFFAYRPPCEKWFSRKQSGFLGRGGFEANRKSHERSSDTLRLWLPHLYTFKHRNYPELAEKIREATGSIKASFDARIAPPSTKSMTSSAGGLQFSTARTNAARS